MDRRKAEAVRYLGYRGHSPDSATVRLIGECLEKLDEIVQKRVVYRIFDLVFPGENRIQIGGMDICSRNLSRNLKGCAAAAVLGATLGVSVDHLMTRYAHTDMARAVVLQACAAASLEAYLDEWQETFRELMEKKGYYLRPRFSPGYGDFSIQYQEAILRVLEAPKKIGLSMTEGSMLTPTKSVTAFIGLSGENTNCHAKGCEVCGKRDCAYRRNQA